MKIIGTNLKDINDLQEMIIVFITHWARTERVPIPRSVVIAEMQKRGKKSFTVINALRSLNTKGYIRKAVVTSNTTSYVLLRGI